LVFLSKFLGNSYDLIPDNFKNDFIFNPENDFQEIFYKMIIIYRTPNKYNYLYDTIYEQVKFKWDVEKVCNNLINDLQHNDK